MKKFLMGNEAIALGAIHAGVNLVAGYPGTPSTEILETVARLNEGNIYVEWSVNEKAALEVAAGASYAGARTLVTMKQVGLNVASDPLMSLAYVGVKGGMVVVSADDPGPISSQTEQDTRTFAGFAKIPVFDPSSPEEAYAMIQDAFAYSEKYQTPVIFRPTTRVCHGCASMEVADSYEVKQPEGFVKDTARYVIFPRTSYLNHLKIEKRNPEIGEELSDYRYNYIEGEGKTGIAGSGVSFSYLKEALKELGTADIRLLKIATAHPFPEKLALEFLDGLSEVLVVEELDPVVEKALIFLCGKYHLNIDIHGKIDGTMACAGENTTEGIKEVLKKWKESPAQAEAEALEQPDKEAEALIQPGSEMPTQAVPEVPALPVRPPVLCAGCPHRASFYAVKRATKGKKAVYSGDIGCYTLGNAKPLDMVDTCLCMGAGITIAQGLQRMEPDTLHFAFAGDSTFFASGITGIVNAVYNQTDIILIILDNSTTAMTGHQPHPATGITMMGEVAEKVSMEKILNAIGLSSVETVNPLDLQASIEAVNRAAEKKGVKAIIFKAPCIAVSKPEKGHQVREEKCINCKKCIHELGCPAIVLKEGRVVIEESLCYGCGLCAQVCPVSAIGREEEA